MSYAPQALVDNLFEHFGTPVTLVDIDSQLVAFSAQPPESIDPMRRETTLSKQLDPVSQQFHDVADRATDFSRVSLLTAAGVLERVVVPLRVKKSVVARLYFIDPHRYVTQEGLDQFKEAIAVSAKQVELDRMSRRTASDLMASLVGFRRAERRLAANVLTTLEPRIAGRPLRLAVLTLGDRAHDTPERLWSESLGSDARRAVVAGKLVLLLPDTPEAPRRIEQALTRLNALGAGELVAAGVGPAARTLSRAHTSYHLALKALRLVEEKLVAGQLADWNQLGGWRPIILMRRGQAELALDPRVRNLVKNENPAVVMATRRFLEGGEKAAQLAEDLHLHRTTLYTRNRSLQERYALQWGDPEDRLATVVGIRIAQYLPATVWDVERPGKEEST